MIGDGTPCDGCGRYLPDLAAILLIGEELGFCGEGCMVAFVRRRWPESRRLRVVV